MTLIIGLTGGIGSGKTIVSNHFKSLGARIVDADVISRKVTEKGRPALVKIANHFGSEVIDDSGNLARAKLRKIIFEDSAQKLWLENLLHPMIRNDIVKALEQNCDAYTILSSPLLFETHQNELTDYTVTVDVPEVMQIARTCERDATSPELVQKVINVQIQRQKRIALSDFIIDNSGAINDTIAAIELLHIKFLTLKKSK